MFQKFLTYIKEGDVYTGLEVYELNGGLRYQVLQLKKTGNELNALKVEKPGTLDALPELVPKNTSLFLTINSSRVLIKKMENSAAGSAEALVDAAFPNLTMDNFYFEVSQIAGTAVVAIVKKDYANEIMEQLGALKLNPVRFCLGFSALGSILPYLDQPVISLSNQYLEMEQGQIQSIQSLSEDIKVEYNINGQPLTNRDLLSFSNILGYLGKYKSVSNFSDNNTILLNEFENKRIFSFVLKGSLLFILFILLGNFLAFDHYYTKIEALKASMELDHSRKNELKVLEASVNRKQERVEALNSNSRSMASYYLDRLARSVPTSVLLDQITYRPVEKQIREAKPIELKDREITIAGNSRDGDLFSQWILSLEQQDWIGSVETTKYEQLTEATSNFQIKLILNEERDQK